MTVSETETALRATETETALRATETKTDTALRATETETALRATETCRSGRMLHPWELLGRNDVRAQGRP